MEKDNKIFLKYILDSIEKIEEFSEDIEKTQFMNSIKTQDAIIRRIEIIGEATKNLSEEFREKHNYIPWKEITKMRDKLIHNYFGIDLEITWNTIKEDIPNLKKEIKKFI